MVFLRGACALMCVCVCVCVCVCIYLFIFNFRKKLWEMLGFFPVFLSIKNSTIKNVNSIHEKKKEKNP